MPVYFVFLIKNSELFLKKEKTNIFILIAGFDAKKLKSASRFFTPVFEAAVAFFQQIDK